MAYEYLKSPIKEKFNDYLAKYGNQKTIVFSGFSAKDKQEYFSLGIELRRLAINRINEIIDNQDLEFLEINSLALMVNSIEEDLRKNKFKGYVIINLKINFTINEICTDLRKIKKLKKMIPKLKNKIINHSIRNNKLDDINEMVVNINLAIQNKIEINYGNVNSLTKTIFSIFSGLNDFICTPNPQHVNNTQKSSILLSDEENNLLKFFNFITPLLDRISDELFKIKTCIIKGMHTNYAYHIRRCYCSWVAITEDFLKRRDCYNRFYFLMKQDIKLHDFALIIILQFFIDKSNLDAEYSNLDLKIARLNKEYKLISNNKYLYGRYQKVFENIMDNYNRFYSGIKSDVNKYYQKSIDSFYKDKSYEELYQLLINFLTTITKELNIYLKDEDTFCLFTQYYIILNELIHLPLRSTQIKEAEKRYRSEMQLLLQNIKKLISKNHPIISAINDNTFFL